MEREVSAERQRQLPMKRREGSYPPVWRLTDSGAHQSWRGRDTAPSPRSCCHGTGRPRPPARGEARGLRGGLPRLRSPQSRHLRAVEGPPPGPPAAGRQRHGLAGPAGAARGLPCAALGLTALPDRGPARARAAPRPEPLAGGRTAAKPAPSLASGPAVSQWRGWAQPGHRLRAPALRSLPCSGPSLIKSP